jgi:probable F420-dependent oxidoreductase
VLLAREAATIDLLSEGRLELGLGAGHMKFEYDEAGISFDPAAVRVARLSESVQIVKRLLHGDTVHFTGEHYTVREHTLSPRPVQARLPILVGGNGRRVLRIAAREADIVGFTGFSQVEGSRDVNLNHFSAAGLEQQVAWVRADAGDRFDQLELNALIQRVDVTTNGSNDSPYLLAGSHEGMAEALRERRERFGLSYFVVFEKAMTDFAPVIDRLKPPTPG